MEMGKEEDHLKIVGSLIENLDNTIEMVMINQGMIDKINLVGRIDRIDLIDRIDRIDLIDRIDRIDMIGRIDK